MSSEEWPWQELDLEGFTEDKRKIKRAYAKKLKTIDQSTELERFAELREAYEYALIICNDNVSHDSLRNIGEGRKEQGDNVVSFSHYSEPSEQELSSADDKVEEGLVDNSSYQEDDDHIQMQNPRSERQHTHENDLGEDAEPYESYHSIDIGQFDEVDDWEHIQRVANRIFEQFNKETDAYNIEQWRQLLEDPGVISFAARRFIEEQLFRALMTETAYGTDREVPYTPTAMTAEFVELLDENFGWVSDGIAVLKRHGSAGDWVLRALTIPRLKFRYNKLSGDTGSQTERVRLPFVMRWYFILFIYIFYRVVITNQ